MYRARALAAASAAAMVAAGLTGLATTATAAPTKATASGASSSWLVLADRGASTAALVKELRAAGATVTSVNEAIGLVSVTSKDARFRASASRIAGVQGVAADVSIGSSPNPVKARADKVEKEHQGATAKGKDKGAKAKKGVKADPLDQYLWGMDMINAPAAHAIERGDKRVTVGVMDTGVDGAHPDLAPNFDAKKSRNFTTDIEAIDGPCEFTGCVDPANVDDNGHGTHVAGTIGAALNGRGVSGVAPGVTLVNVRAGQDSGYFFLGPVTNALTYSGDIGIDVVNMSFYVDPWLYNCRGGAPEDSAPAAADQEIIIAAMTRALNYANARGVTLVGALGNNHEDLAKPRVDLSSPDYDNPAYDWDTAPYPRTISNANCLDLPVEGPNVIGVSSLGPTGTKSDFSNYTTDLSSGEIEVSAPGGWFRDGFGTDTYRTNGNLILSTAPLHVLQAEGAVDEDGNITPDGEAAGVMKECVKRVCGYYQYLQGTSMASPHAAGVAALAVSAHGRVDGKRGLTMAPDAVAMLMMRTATDHACPPGGVRSYAQEGRSAEWTATCVGNADFNGFYGAGIVNALGVVQ
ncbi:S8 family serine peptidase [Knoellia koreensis]|uniref:S8 family serine peptidase n=1 Tax=Knoellia koreensis TaxID=2730921 RepID=A0A849HL47_9MICO|nr:S8 family serine peptidase [Knoellia sp. DB2414S]NNM47274.1 S8 family serine peptidase [Knoellia sp. DB2414S]